MDTSEYKTIIYEEIGPITKIVHNEPEKRNALTGQFILEFGDALHKFERNPEARAAVIFSTGSCFCSGHNIQFVSKMEDWKSESKPSSSEQKSAPTTEQDWRNQMDFMRDKFYYPLWDCKKPLVVGVQGGAYTGGAFFAGACDIVVAAEEAFFDWGVQHVTGTGGDVMLAYFGGWRKAMEMALTGWNMDAMEAWRIGLVSKVVPADKLEKEVMRYAKIIAAMRPENVKLSKQHLKQMMNRLGVREGIFLEYETNILGHLARTEWENEFYKMMRQDGIKAAVDFAHKPFEELGYSRYGPSGRKQGKTKK